MSWAICNEGEGIIIPRPMYGGFILDIPARCGAIAVGAEYQDVGGYSGFDNVFVPEMNRKALEAAYAKALKKGVKCRALLISQYAFPMGW